MATTPRIPFIPLLLASIALLASSQLTAQIADFENAPIYYQKAKVNDPVAQLKARLESGKTKLDYTPEHGYLESLLKELDIRPSSQCLVFSKTSLQVQRISPLRPRALYFNDNVYVGWCQHGDIIELAATDAKEGPTFYSIKQKPNQPPTIIRDQGQCIVCHASSRTQNVPGYLVRSILTNRSGRAILGSGTSTTDITSPFQERWGGWYVTGTHGDMRHMGNTIFENNSPHPNLESGANRKTLDGLVSTQPYLTPHSDLVALMVLEHQTQMHNAITFANFETRQALHQSFEMNKVLDRAPDFVSPLAQRRIDAAAQRVLEHLLMANEFQLTSPVAGTSDFTKEFSARGKRDSKNRSLRDFNLQTRLFQYPCSYLIYSPSFDGLPDQVRKKIYARLHNILDGNDPSDTWKHLTPELRQAIREILSETKPEFSQTQPTHQKN